MADAGSMEGRTQHNCIITSSCYLTSHKLEMTKDLWYSVLVSNNNAKLMIVIK